MKRKLCTAAVALAVTGAAFATAAASPAVATSLGSAKPDCLLGAFVQKENGETYTLGRVYWCDNGDKIGVNDMAYDGRALGVRVDDGSGKYRWCKDVSGADDKWKDCSFDLKENRRIKVRGYLEKKGQKSIWLNTHTFYN